MSDNEFFFDDEQKAEPAPKTKPSPGGAVKKKPAPKSAPRPVVDSDRVVVVEQQSVTITIAMLIGVVALLVGVISGIFVGRAMVPETVGAPVAPATSTMGTGGSGSAPALTDEQIKSGVMPGGVPDTGSTADTSTAK